MPRTSSSDHTPVQHRTTPPAASVLPTLRALPGLIAAFSVLAAWALLRERSIDVPERRLAQLDPVDLRVYDRAATHLWNGGDLYAQSFVGPLPFTYPPFAGVFFTPFAWSDNVLATTVLWQGLNVLCLVGVILLVIRRFFRLPLTSLPLALVLALAIAAGSLLLSPIRQNFFYGQINCLLMMLVAVDFLPRAAGDTHGPSYPRHWLVGVGTGLAAGLKLTPAFFILLFLIQRRFRAAAVAAATFVLTVLIGFWRVPDAAAFWTGAISDNSRIGDHANRGAQSIRSLLYRTLQATGRDPGGADSATLTAWWIGLSFLSVIIFAVGAWLGHRRGQVVFPVALAGVTACLISPFTWLHHWVWLVPLAVAGICASIAAAQSLLHRVGWLTMQILAVVLVAGAVIMFSPMAEWRYFPDLYIFAHRTDDAHWLNWMRIGVGFFSLLLYLLVNASLLFSRRSNKKHKEDIKATPDTPVTVA